MLGIETFTNRTLMAILAALGYALATFLMKLTAETASLLLFFGIAAVLLVTVTAEILLLRQVDLGMAYIAIIATETLLVLGFTVLVGETLSAREMLGGALVVSGAVLVSF